MAVFEVKKNQQVKRVHTESRLVIERKSHENDPALSSKEKSLTILLFD